jgi:Asp-tRNA(Asn)/Glu-tRNA(Gln) amidotransferase A subunit family amidase
VFHESGCLHIDEWTDIHDDIDFGIRVRLAAGCLVPAVLYSKAMRGRAAVRAEVLERFQQFDVLVLPTIRTPPPRIDNIPRKASTLEEVLASVVARRKNAYPFSVANTPAMSVPMGFAKSGLPVGLQIVGRPFDEATVLRVGDAYERATSWTAQHPDLAATVSRFEADA